jgi:hypothetical protein
MLAGLLGLEDQSSSSWPGFTILYFTLLVLVFANAVLLSGSITQVSHGLPCHAASDVTSTTGSDEMGGCAICSR